jgi:hypothetical protein
MLETIYPDMPDITLSGELFLEEVGYYFTPKYEFDNSSTKRESCMHRMIIRAINESLKENKIVPYWGHYLLFTLYWFGWSDL